MEGNLLKNRLWEELTNRQSRSDRTWNTWRRGKGEPVHREMVDVLRDRKQNKWNRKNVLRNFLEMKRDMNQQ